MSDQSVYIQAVEQALRDAGIEYELQSADVVDSIIGSDGSAEPYIVDVKLRIHSDGGFGENNDG